MSDTNVVNPGLVNVADQSDGEILVNQTITVSPPTNSGPLTQGGSLAPGQGVAATCYQVRQCNFSNIKEEPSDPRHLRVIQNLFEPLKK